MRGARVKKRRRRDGRLLCGFDNSRRLQYWPGTLTMLPMFSDQTVPASPELIRKAENLMGLPFPESYKGFLLKYNGSVPIVDTFQAGGENIFLQIFWRLVDSEEQTGGILREWGNWKSACQTQSLIPIGRTSAGSLFLQAGSEQLFVSMFNEDPPQPLGVLFVELLKMLHTDQQPRESANIIDRLGEAVDSKEVEEYLSNGGDVNARDTSGMTLAENFLAARNIPMFKLILRYGPRLDGAFHKIFQVARGRDIIRELVAAGADINERDAEGRRVVDAFPSWREDFIEFGAEP
jgi:SMI1-KNR4 cell-wall